MTTERIVRFVAGLFILSSLAFGMTDSPAFLSVNWLWLAVFVGANLFQSSFTGFCPLEIILKKAGVQEGCPKPA